MQPGLRAAWRGRHSGMRSADARQSTLFSMTSTEDRIPARHPLRAVRTAAAEALAGVRWQIEKLYDPASATATVVAPEEVLRALLLFALYGIPSERRLIEELEYNLLYRWFVGLQLDDPVFKRVTFREHRARLIKSGILGEFIRRTLSGTRVQVMRNPHFAPNKPLLDAWTGQQRWDR
jgi:transposase